MFVAQTSPFDFHLCSIVCQSLVAFCFFLLLSEAKIDSERNRVELATLTQNVYQQVVDKTRNLVVRTNVLIQNLDRPAGSQSVTAIRNIGASDFAAFRQRGALSRGGGTGVGLAPGRSLTEALSAGSNGPCIYEIIF